jgi:hypothetical protein
VTEAAFDDLSGKIQQCFDAVSLADLCSRAEQQGVRRPGAHRYMYVI